MATIIFNEDTTKGEITSEKKDEEIILDTKVKETTSNIDDNVEETVHPTITEETIPDDNIEEKNTEKSGNFDTLVISGGGVNGLTMLGFLQYATDNYLINNINTYVGTSVGSILGYLLAIGYTPIEIMVYICTNHLFERLKYFNIVAMYNGQGATTFSHINEQLEKLTIEKLGRLLTLGELYSMTKKRLICVTHNMTTDKTEYLDYLTYPNMPCLIALRLSSNLPLIFDHFKYLGNYYIDGGSSDNFPINKGEEVGDKILGVFVNNNSGIFEPEKDNNILEYIYRIMMIPADKLVNQQINNISEKCSIFKLNTSEFKPFDFNIDSQTKLEMFSMGYQEMKKLWEK